MTLNNEMMQEEAQSKDNRKFSLKERYPLLEKIYLRLFFATYGMVTNALAGLDRVYIIKTETNIYVVTCCILFSFCAYDSLSPNFEVFSS